MKKEKQYLNCYSNLQIVAMGGSAGKQRSCPYRGCYFVLFITTALGLLLPATMLVILNYHDMGENNNDSEFPIPTAEPLKEILITEDSPLPNARLLHCLYHTCFEVYQCGNNDDERMTVFVYPPAKYIDKDGVPVTLPITKEYSDIIQTIANSAYYTTDPTKACLFIPPIDLLNQNNVRLEQAGKILASLQYWNSGTNHILFNMFPGSLPDYNTSLDVRTDKAIIAGGGFDTWSYRRTYDVSIPLYNPLVADIGLPEKSHLEKRQYLLVSTQMGLHTEYLADLDQAKQSSTKNEFLTVGKCDGKFNYSTRCAMGETYDYMTLLQDSSFCLVIRGSRLSQPTLYDALKAGCIPVVVADGYVLPFNEVLDWQRALIRVSEENLQNVLHIVELVPTKKLLEMRQQVKFFYENYFLSMEAITLTTLQIINDRVFPYAARKFEEWNDRPYTYQVNAPLFLPLVPPKQMGFTAVILTYDRLESLFTVIHQVAKAPNLAKVLVVWNNQQKSPPQASAWPKINKPLKVVQTRYNKLSNRFYPYDEIETEAILALDDDILMLTTDELEFGYQVWREFSDRLVGYPSRIHKWDSESLSWKYESEWTSNISMVLTGAAFYHKYYSYLYTNSLPGNIKTWVDDHMNCEDLAMNFLIANMTGKAPIKVAPRQKFKCTGVSECGSIMLSADVSHMVERSECISKFSQIYNTMPLKSVEFRADPILYKETLPEHLKIYNDIGNL